jgi:hypothetical protein
MWSSEITLDILDSGNKVIWTPITSKCNPEKIDFDELSNCLLSKFFLENVTNVQIVLARFYLIMKIPLVL